MFYLLFGLGWYISFSFIIKSLSFIKEWKQFDDLFESSLFSPRKGSFSTSPKVHWKFYSVFTKLGKDFPNWCISNKATEKIFHSDLPLFNQVGPKGLEFARYSLDYHTIRNYLYTNRTWGKDRYSSWVKWIMNFLIMHCHYF